MSKNKYQKIKAEIFKLSTLNKFVLDHKMITKHSHNISKMKSDEFGYFSTLDNL